MQIPNAWATLCLACMAVAGSASGSEMASATIDPTVLGGGLFQYDITLNDIGTTPLGTFWFSWIPGQDYMPVMPTNIDSPMGWSDIVTHGGVTDGYAIQWVAGSSEVLQPGQSSSGYEFQSTVTPAELAAPNVFYTTNSLSSLFGSNLASAMATSDSIPLSNSVVTSVVYTAGPLSDAGFQFVPAISSVPEPSTMLWTSVIFGALLVLLIFGYRRPD
ncbi:MAG TPA: hypothetical protein VKB88_33000 [Bryobacteraceae bacterium]|nr:hypothetical protein [Bryobacteraceae bacterium]